MTYLRSVLLAAALAACATEHAVSPTAPPTAHAAAAASGTHVVINEIMADPSAVPDAAGEWFEVYNPTTSAIDLRGWQIASANDAAHTIASSVVVPAGGYAVFGRNGDPSANGGVMEDYVYANGSATLNLANSATDWLKLVDTTGATVDSVFWGATPPTGRSRAVVDPSADHTLMSGPNWMTSTTPYGAGDKGTPGAANDGSTPSQPGGPVATVALSPASATVQLGGTLRLTPTARDANGTVVATTYTWTSSNDAVASVDTTGTITARAIGRATITAHAADGVTGTATITVPSSSAVYRNNLEFGTPTDANPSDDILIERPQYALSYDATRGGPNWVSWELNSTQFGSAPRCDCFSADPALPDNVYHVVTSDYTGSGYDRGHMTASIERSVTPADNAVTYYITNILPQYHDLNAGPWEDFESYTHTLVQAQGKELYIISGGIFHAGAATLKNEGKVAIPDSTWKIVVVVDNGKGVADVRSTADLQVIAVNMPNVTGILSQPWQNYVTTVDAIERSTGYDFLAALPDSIETIVEANDHAPVATLAASGATTASIGQAVSVVGRFTDVDGQSSAPWTYQFTWGDGSVTRGVQGAAPTSTTQFLRSHSYASPGTYTVTFGVTDRYGAGVAAQQSITVTP